MASQKIPEELPCHRSSKISLTFFQAGVDCGSFTWGKWKYSCVKCRNAELRKAENFIHDSLVHWMIWLAMLYRLNIFRQISEFYMCKAGQVACLYYPPELSQCQCVARRQFSVHEKSVVTKWPNWHNCSLLPVGFGFWVWLVPTANCWSSLKELTSWLPKAIGFSWRLFQDFDLDHGRGQ